MKLSYIAPVVRVAESIDSRLARLNFEKFKRCIMKILGYLTSFAIGIKVGAISVGQLFGDISSIGEVVAMADSGMYFTVTIFSMILLMNHMIRMCSGDCKDKNFLACIGDYLKIIGGTVLFYVLYLTCHRWVAIIFDGIGFVLGL